MSTAVGNLKKTMQKGARFLEELDALIDAEPALGRLIYLALHESYGHESNGEAPRVAPRARPGRPSKSAGRVEKVVDAIKAKPWMTTPELREATGFSKVQLAVVLRDYADTFESRKDVTNERRLQWRVKEKAQPRKHLGE